LKALYGFLCLPSLLVIQGLIFLILNVLDGHSTWLVLRPDNYQRERNPLARWFFRKLHLPRAIVIYKIVILAALSMMFYAYYKESLTLNIALLIGNIVLIFVVRHNYRVHRRYAQLHG